MMRATFALKFPMVHNSAISRRRTDQLGKRENFTNVALRDRWYNQVRIEMEHRGQDDVFHSSYLEGAFLAFETGVPVLRDNELYVKRCSSIIESGGLRTYHGRIMKNQLRLANFDTDFTSIREDFRVALNTLSGDLKHEIHDLRDSFMGEITKIREEFEEEVSTLHQVIEGLQADMALWQAVLG
ncbi:hypothetical protein Tco_0845415 [Tanacetum coccineum]